MYGYTARHNPEQFAALAGFDDADPAVRYAAPTRRYDDSNDADALAFFSLSADDTGASE